MQCLEDQERYLTQIKSVELTKTLAKRLISLTDLTSLNESDTEDSILKLLSAAHTPLGPVAAVCVFPRFVSLAAQELRGTPIKVATVINFPGGDSGLDIAMADIQKALAEGATEIDLVFPYHRYLTGDHHYAQLFVSSCKTAVGEHLLKVILETGALSDREMIREASNAVFLAGADFVKTSTGKIKPGATLESALQLLLSTKILREQLQRPLGTKISGGISSPDEALKYLQLADLVLNAKTVNALSFRIGSSRLIEEIFKNLPGF